MIDRMEARVGTRGRVTIPVELRRRLGIKPGTRLIVREEEGRIVVMTMASCIVRSLRGVLKGKGIDGEIEGGETERIRVTQFRMTEFRQSLSIHSFDTI